MTSIYNNDLFEKYYQKEYDFNTLSLEKAEINAIKKLAREKRVDYALAPIGTGIFEWISKQSQNIQFELIGFDSCRIDGMMYIPVIGKEKAFFILNSNKPLVNQIFTTAHFFYHYICDHKKFKDEPYICDFSMLKNVEEKKACRFASELLLPEEALKREVEDFCRIVEFRDLDRAEFSEVAAFFIALTLKYQMPLKAVIYRLLEEKYINSIGRYIDSYDFIKRLLIEIKLKKSLVTTLYRTKNVYVTPYGKIYQDMEKAYLSGNASKIEVLRDAEELCLEMSLIDEFLSKKVFKDDFNDNSENPPVV